VSAQGWIGVDLDGTLAHYDVWRGPEHIGAPVPAMVERVKGWRQQGIEVRVFTARVCIADHDEQFRVRLLVEDWCVEHLGSRLPVTNVKDFAMVELWDDRCVRVVKNTGERCCG
jgi:hypothetical protein